ncbi:MAG: cytochrome b/b6 domain-containing protein [Planctomycetes bacterium]|nr:cytochrome b/b6 domain-containing protein [Planctomycetota bacterium]
MAIWLATGLGTVTCGQTPEAVKCGDCHGESTDARQAAPPEELLKESIHKRLECTDCHTSISAENLDLNSGRPHGGSPKPVDCGSCHEAEKEIYAKHGRLAIDRDPDVPKCWSCHGSHDVQPSSDRRARVHPTNLPGTCRECHANVDLVKRHDVLRLLPILTYQSSVHGTATRKGIYVAASCNDCHSARGPDGKRTAHRILGPADPDSPVFHFSIPDTCGQCHDPVTRDYWEGIHGQLVKRGAVDAPVCTHCHGEHGIVSPRDTRSPVSATHLAEQTCAPCHESAVLNQKYGLAKGRLASYIDSYHGLKSKAGDATVANCASCHGAHRILPSTDASSSIHPDNLRATCGECHPNISTELANTRIHETSTGLHAGWPEFFRQLYIVLIIATIGGMLLHNGADWLRHVTQLRRRPFVQRLSLSEVMQHWALMLSFCVLVVSGFSLRFSEAAWVKFLFGWEGGFEVRGVIHRAAAIVMVLTSIWHALYLVTRRGRQWFKDMCVRISDLVDFGQNLAYFVGRRSERPRFGRFSYMEKVEYWALVWGTVIMSVTGGLLWFDNELVRQWNLPKGILDVSLVIHYYEAWLATLAILVWHIYGTVFSPAAYPMNTAWLAGRMPKEMYAHEHASGPKLKARTYTVHLEDEQEPNAAVSVSAALVPRPTGESPGNAAPSDDGSLARIG